MGNEVSVYDSQAGKQLSLKVVCPEEGCPTGFCKLVESEKMTFLVKNDFAEASPNYIKDILEKRLRPLPITQSDGRS